MEIQLAPSQAFKGLRKNLSDRKAKMCQALRQESVGSDRRTVELTNGWVRRG